MEEKVSFSVKITILRYFAFSNAARELALHSADHQL